MNVLCHGAPFCCDYALLGAYAGRHDVRWLGIDPRARYRFDPLDDDMHSVLARVRAEWKPDLLLCWTPEIYPPPLGVEHADIPTAALVSDWNVHFSLLRGNVTRFDTVLCDRAGVAVLSPYHGNVHHVMPLYSRIPGVHCRHEVSRDIDVAYVGNLNVAAHPRRARLLARLAGMTDRYHVLVSSGITGAAYAHVLSRAKIVFNCSVRGEMNLRVFETLACGAAAMLEHDNREVRDWLAEDREVIVYRDESIEATVIDALESGRWRDVAEAGYARSDALAGENRLDDLIDWLSRCQRGKRAFLSLSDDERDYQDLLLYGFSRWPQYAPLRAHLAGELVRRVPSDPRYWTALGRHLLPGGDSADRDSARAIAVKAFTQAHRLRPDSAPLALNAATLCRAFGLVDKEAAFLEAALEASSLDGAELAIGNPGCAFWNRWARAVAEQGATIDMLHAEARVRLAVILAANGRAAEAARHLEAARGLDPQNHGGTRLEAEILWARGNRGDALRLLEGGLDGAPLDTDYLRRMAEMGGAVGDAEAVRLAERGLWAIEGAMRLPE